MISESRCRGTNYFEVDVDISSSRAANSVVGMVQGATNSLVIDMGIVLEGHTEEELPECLLGTVRLQNLDMQASGLRPFDRRYCSSDPPLCAQVEVYARCSAEQAICLKVTA